MDYFDKLMDDYDFSCDSEIVEQSIEKKNDNSFDFLKDYYSVNSTESNNKNGNASKWNIIFSLFVYLILIPLTFYVSFKSGDRKLLVGSIIIMFLAMLPFFVNFERKKPNARELVTIAVLTAIAVISRVAFMWLPAFKIMAGIIVISAMNFGPQAGFMCGALSMIISNIVFGQGTWTPWQMFCYGLIGFIGGLLAKYGILSEKHALRSGIITFFIVTILSSIILDSSTLFFMFSRISKASILSIYIAGLPINVLNGLASGLAVTLLSKPIYFIIKRLKIKYGLTNYF